MLRFAIIGYSCYVLHRRLRYSASIRPLGPPTTLLVPMSLALLIYILLNATP